MSKPQIVASLTTLPKRLKFIQPTLDSILSQTLSVQKIYLHIPNETKRTKETYDEKELQQLKEKYPKLVINRCEIDYGPITKIVPITDLIDDNDTLILCIDDDTIYKPLLLKHLYNCHLRNPNAVVGMGGFSIGTWPFYIQFVTANRKDVQVDVLQGVHAILYQRKQLDKNKMITLQPTDPKELWYNDDHQLALYFVRQNVPLISCKGSIKDYVRYCNHNTIDALSGRRYKKMEESIKIITYMKKKGYYKNNYSIGTSIVFYILAFVILFFIVIGGCFTNYGNEVFTGACLVALLLIVSIISYNVY